MILPMGIRWWLVLQRQLSFHFSPLSVSVYLSCPRFFPFFVLGQQYSLVTNKTHIAHRYTLTYSDRHMHADTHKGRHGFLVRFHLGVQQWQPHLSGVCVWVCECACMRGFLSVGRGQTSTCWFWCIELLPVCHIQLQLWTADAYSLPLCVCARVFVAHLQLCRADVTSHKHPLVIFSSRSGIILLLLF